MRRELFETGKSVDGAIDSACEKLGCLRDNCEWEIIDLPKKGFLGLKNTPAKVRVSIEVVDNEKQKDLSGREEAAEKKSDFKPKSANFIQNAKRNSVPNDNAVKNPEPAPGFKNAQQSKPAEVKAEDMCEKEKFAIEYLTEIMGVMGLNPSFTLTRQQEGSCININGEGLGVIIGRRGDALDAIQYLTGLVANRGGGDYLRFIVDCGDYRLKRRITLEALARKLASQVLKSNVSKALEPMNPFERRVIHATVSEIEGVTSSSIGTEPNRRVIITTPTARPAPRNAFRDRRDSETTGGFNRAAPLRRDTRSTEGEGEKPHFNDRPARHSRDNSRPGSRGSGRGNTARTSQTPQNPPKQTPEAQATTGISFGKIDLE